MPAGASASWRGACRSRFALPVSLVLVVGGAVVAIAGEVVAGVLVALAGLTVLALIEIRAEVAGDTFRISYSGPLAWPTTSLSLHDVATVEVIDVHPLRYGGWGYRGSLRLFRRAALNLRKGPGLRFGLRDGRVFVVTVDDPDGAVSAMRPIVPQASR